MDKFVLSPFTLRQAARTADVVHLCDRGNAMDVARVVGRPNVLACHDVIALAAARSTQPSRAMRRTGRIFQLLIARGVAQAQRVVCVSRSTERELARLGLVDPQRVSYVPNGLNNDFAPVPQPGATRRLARFGLTAEDRYLLHVGLGLPHNNRSAVLQTLIALQDAAHATDTPPPVRKLVFVGRRLDAAMTADAERHEVPTPSCAAPTSHTRNSARCTQAPQHCSFHRFGKASGGR